MTDERIIEKLESLRWFVLHYDCPLKAYRLIYSTLPADRSCDVIVDVNSPIEKNLESAIEEARVRMRQDWRTEKVLNELGEAMTDWSICK